MFLMRFHWFIKSIFIKHLLCILIHKDLLLMSFLWSWSLYTKLHFFLSSQILILLVRILSLKHQNPIQAVLVKKKDFLERTISGTWQPSSKSNRIHVGKGTEGPQQIPPKSIGKVPEVTALIYSLVQLWLWILASVTRLPMQTRWHCWGHCHKNEFSTVPRSHVTVLARNIQWAKHWLLIVATQNKGGAFGAYVSKYRKIAQFLGIWCG